MSVIKILVFEDSVQKVESFNSLLNLKSTTEFGVTTEVIIREDESFLEADLMLNISIILVDDDLANGRWGSEMISDIIALIDGNPDYKSVPIVYYSAGTDLVELKEKSKIWGGVRCCTYDDLVDIVLKIVERVTKNGNFR